MPLAISQRLEPVEHMSESQPVAPRRPVSARPAGTPPTSNRLHVQVEDAAFFRHVVAGMRNGVLATTRDGGIALINDEAYRIFGMEPRSGDMGRPRTIAAIGGRTPA